MPRARSLVLAVAAAAVGAVFWSSRPTDDRTPTAPPVRSSTKRDAARSRRQGAPLASTASLASAPAPRPGRRVSFFHAPSRGADVAKIARDLIVEHRRELGIDSMPGELRETQEFDSLSGRHLRFEQTLDGVSVFGSEVSAHVARDGRPLLVQANVYPVLGAETSPKVAARRARDAAVVWARDDGSPSRVDTKSPRLTILPEGRRGRLVWRVDVRTADDSSRVFVDAADGAIVRSDSLRVGVDGSGVVFDPNPVYTLRDGSLRDRKDVDSGSLSGALVAVTLPRLDGTGLLRGRWVDVTTTVSPAFSPALDWSGVTRSSPQFEQVMAYFHLDRSQQRLQELGITNANASPQRVDAHATSQDQSYYDAYNDEIRLGDGGVDDAEDADIICHEYGHAIQFAQVTDWGLSSEGAALGEGFGDFHAASFHSGDPVFDPLVGSWDATSYSKASPPFLRRVDLAKRYPDDLADEPHADGQIWSRFLWDLRALIGTDDALRVAVESHFLLTPTAHFDEAANAVLLANASVRDGADDVAIRGLLDARGLVYTVPFAHPPVDDAFEPNDDVEHPAPIAPGLRAGLVSADADWYRIDVPGKRRFHVTATFDPDVADLEVALYAVTGTSGAASDFVGSSNEVSGVDAVDATAGAGGASFLVDVHDARTGTHVSAYDLNVIDAELTSLVRGRSTLVHVASRAPSVYRVDVPETRVGRRLHVTSSRRGRHGPAGDVRITSPSGTVVVDFGEGKSRGARAVAQIGEPGAWIVEIRSRDAKKGAVKVRAKF